MSEVTEVQSVLNCLRVAVFRVVAERTLASGAFVGCAPGL